MNTPDADDPNLDEALNGSLLHVPDDFTARVMAALPARSVRFEPRRRAPRAWRFLQALVVTGCGALGLIEVLLYVCGLWAATAVAVG